MLPLERRLSTQPQTLAGSRRTSMYNSMPGKINIHSLKLTEKDLQMLGQSPKKNTLAVVPDGRDGEEYTEGVELGERSQLPEDVQLLREKLLEAEGQDKSEDWLVDEQLKDKLKKLQRLQTKLTIHTAGENSLYMYCTVISRASAPCKCYSM